MRTNTNIPNSQKPGDLLVQVPFPEGRTANFDKRPPIMYEIPVNKDLAPFLVSSTRSVIWVPRASKTGSVRVAVRSDIEDPEDFYKTVVKSACQQGAECSWGNVHAPNKQGLRDAISYVRYYDIPDVEILANPKFDWKQISDAKMSDKDIALMFDGCLIQPAPWLDNNMLLVVPKDRTLLGVYFWHKGYFGSLIHNASRGMAIVSLSNGYTEQTKAQLTLVAKNRGIKVLKKTTKQDLVKMLTNYDETMADRSPQ